MIELLQRNQVDLAAPDYVEIRERYATPAIELDMLDLNLPIPNEPIPTLPDLPLQTVYAIYAEYCASLSYDDAYYARSLAAKNHVPFVM